jgi:hypothetical protein
MIGEKSFGCRSMWTILTVTRVIFADLVIHCMPYVDKMNDLVGKLNENKDLYQFLKESRKAFVLYCKTR